MAPRLLSRRADVDQDLVLRTEEAGYVEIKKTFRGKVPRTLLRLTKPGRQAFEEYRKKLSRLLKFSLSK